MSRFALPDGWHTPSLAEVAKVQTGIALGKANVADPVRLPYLRVANVQDGHFDLREVKTITLARRDVARYSLQDGDVLLTEGGDFDKLGRGGVWRGQVPECVHQNHVFVVRVERNKLLPEYLALYCASLYGKNYFLSCSKQTTNLASINSTQLKEMPLPLPPLAEQRAIAAILSTWDRATELTEKLLTAHQQRKAALMQQLFTGKVRLPGFRDRWEPAKMGRFLKESRLSGSGGDSARKLTVKLYGKGVVPKADPRPGSAETRYYKRRAGQFIYSKLDFLNGAFGLIPRELDGYESTLDLPAFDIGGEADARWVLLFVTREAFYKAGVSLANGGRKARRVNPSDFLKTEVPLPPLAEQRAIAAVLNTADCELALLRRKLDALRRQKRGLMQQLLTGRVRVTVAASSGE